VSFDLRTAARGLGLGTAAVALAGLAIELGSHFSGHTHMKGLVPLLRLDAERNVPTFYSGALLLAASLASLLALNVARQAGDRPRAEWGILAAGFLFMAYDEVMRVHEHLHRPAVALVGEDVSPWLHNTWIVAGALIAALVGAVMLRFLASLWPPFRNRLLLAGGLFLGGALGVEAIGGAVRATAGDATLLYALVSVVEETLEMAGITFYVWVVLSHVAMRAQPVRLTFGGRGTPRAAD
jgi:hypothetical protein